MVKTNIADIRQEYSKSGLRESELPGDPLSLFSRWLQEAIDANVEEPTAVIVWQELERQVHIEGVATKVPSEESDEYFRKRPYKSRIGARISPQSQPIASRMQLIRAFVREAARWIGKEVERPDNWGGYAVTPTRMEFWQGRPNRLHDRFLYTLKTDGKWEINRLSP